MEELHICPISGNKMRPVFSAIVMKKYNVTYYFCDKCGLLQTEYPYWLEEAYQEPIGGADTGHVYRNITNQKKVEPIIHRLYSDKAVFLDVGGGYGLFARLMRDRGFNCFTTDKFCKNIFAKGFEPDEKFAADCLFAFEVLEHIENPYIFLKNAFCKYNCRSIIFSTVLFEETIPPKDWWYYDFDGGQHITFYQTKTLVFLAKKLGCRYYRLSKDFYIILDKSISKFDLFLFSNKLLFKLYSLIVHIKRNNCNKIWEDFLYIKNKKL